jgi:hypothetical protein
MSQGPFTTNGSVATTAASYASREVRWHRIALVAKLAGGWLGGTGLGQLGFISQQHARNNVSRLIIARPIAHRGDPVLTIPGDDVSIARKAGTKLHRAR